MAGQPGNHANVDFAYTGPPVVVSNGQALDLVRQFGELNAWYAYLKLQGMNLSKEEAEKAVALKKFRNKIRRLKKAADGLKDRREDFDWLLGKEFSTFLQPNSLELKKDDGSGSEESDAKEDSPEENVRDIPSTSSSLPGLQVIQTSNSSSCSTPATTQKLPAALKCESSEKKRHQETIDDVVSSIMEKIRNNLPFEGELTLSSSTSTQVPGTKAPKKSKTSKRDAKPVFATAQPDQVTILSNFSEIIRASTSKQLPPTLPADSPLHQPSGHPAAFPTAFTVPFANLNLSALTGQGITLPNNLTVQALLQSIQQQAKKVQMVQQQETLPDSSSQDVVFQHNQDAPLPASLPIPSPQPNKKRQPAKKKVEKLSSPETAKKVKESETSAQTKEGTKNSFVSDKKVNKKSKHSVKTEDIKVELKSSEEDLKRISELESQLSKCQKQLTAEKNKFNNQKKRLEKVLNDLEKSADAIQLVQIDMACQKTDNNNLIAENITLKAEIQQLRSKDSFSKSSIASKNKGKAGKSSSKASKSAAAKRGRKATSPSPRANEPTMEQPLEYGRRQSKRICVSRSRFLYGLI